MLALDVATLEHAVGPELTSADVVLVDAEIAERFGVIDKVSLGAPGIEFVLVGDGSGSHPGVVDRLVRPLDLDRLLRIVDELADVLDGDRLREPIDLVAYESLFAGDSAVIRELLRCVRLVARSEAPVWIFGDDGSGRSVIARALHDRSSRRRQKFLAFNSGAYADDELCRRLFDGDQAAVNVARGGTLFIDRLALAGPNTQRELMSYVESRAKDDNAPRLVIGLQRDAVAAGAQSFTTTELFYRLKVLELDIPALKDRVIDLPQIVSRMLERLSFGVPRSAVSSDAMKLLGRYAFPGNVMELAHALTHAFVLAGSGTIEAHHLPVAIRNTAADGETVSAIEGELQALDVVAKRFERDYLLRVLRSVAGNRGRAAEILGLSRKGLWGKLKSHGLSDADIDEPDAP